MNTDWPSAIAAGWHPLATATALGNKPLRRQLMGMPLALFRGADGQAVVLQDRCPHRAMPLSLGRVENGAIVCPYHGWSFGAGGRCLAVPGSGEIPDVRATCLPVREQAGLIWTNLSPRPDRFPDLPETLEDTRLDRFWWPVSPSRAGVLDALENHLDPAHPHFLHPGLVRRHGRRRPVTVTVRTGPYGAEAIYEETPASQTWLPRLIEGTRVRSIGRYYPPAIGEVVFEGKIGFTLSIAVIFVPEDRGLTRPFAHLATPRGVLPAWFKRLALKAFHLPVLRQDQRALARQAASQADTGEGGYHNGPLDFLGPTIWKLAHGVAVPQEERVTEITL